MITKASPARVLVKYLVNDGVVFANASDALEWKATWSAIPDNAVDNFVIVYDTTPVVLGTEMKTGITHRNHGIQVRVRALDYDTGWAKCMAIEASLAKIKNCESFVTLIDVPGWTFKLHKFVLKIPTTKILEEDQNQRLHFTINGLLVASERAA